MKRFTGIFVLLLLVGTAPETWAGAADEVAEIGRQRTRAFIEGNLDAYTAAFADNAVATFSITPFRVEGRDAIRAFYENLFQTYPTRRVAVRQPLIRVYNNETTVITNNYTHGMLVDW